MICGDDNLPMPLYHGSYKEILEFRPLRSHDMAGIYFTPNYEEAVNLAHDNCVDDDDTPTVMVAHLDIRKPFVMEGLESQVISVQKRDELLAMGYDGVIGTSRGKPFEYVAFDPSQITIVSVDCERELPEDTQRMSLSM